MMRSKKCRLSHPFRNGFSDPHQKVPSMDIKWNGPIPCVSTSSIWVLAIVQYKNQRRQGQRKTLFQGVNWTYELWIRSPFLHWLSYKGRLQAVRRKSVSLTFKCCKKVLQYTWHKRPKLQMGKELLPLKNTESFWPKDLFYHNWKLSMLNIFYQIVEGGN